MFLVAIVLSTGRVTCVCNAKARETGPLNAKNNGLVSLRKPVELGFAYQESPYLVFYHQPLVVSKHSVRVKSAPLSQAGVTLKAGRMLGCSFQDGT